MRWKPLKITCYLWKKVDGKFAEFSCYLKNHFNHAIPLSFDFGLLESRDILSADSYTKLIQNIRDGYCTPKAQLDFGTSHISKTKQKEVSKNEPLQTAKLESQPAQEKATKEPVEIVEIPKEIESVKNAEPTETVELIKQ